jgi:hypothetical protein
VWCGGVVANMHTAILQATLGMREGKARQGKARQGKARQGKARQGKAKHGAIW